MFSPSVGHEHASESLACRVIIFRYVATRCRNVWRQNLKELMVGNQRTPHSSNNLDLSTVDYPDPERRPLILIQLEDEVGQEARPPIVETRKRKQHWE